VPGQSIRQEGIAQGLTLAAALAYTALLAWASLYPVAPDSALAATATRRTINNLLHVPAYAVLAVAWIVVLRVRAGPAAFTGAVAAFGFGVLMELAQALVPGRSASAGDSALNGLGVLLGWGAAQMFATARARGSLRILRRRNWLCRVAAAAVALGCVGAMGLFAMYRWPALNVPMFYFIVRPAFVWFVALAPLLLAGFFGVRYRWFLIGFALWMVALWATEEVGQAWNLRPAANHPCSIALAQGEVVRMPLRVVTWNMLGARRGADEVLEELARVRPDLAFLQEFPAGWRIEEPLEENGFFRGCYLSEVRGNALLSRWPVERVAAGPLHGRRGGAWAVRLASDVQVVCLNVHLTPIRLRTQLVRRWTVAGLRKMIEKKARDLADLRVALDRFEGRPVILAGDFNAPPHYPGLARATRGLVDCFAAGGRGWGRTAPAKLPVVRVDMVFVPWGAKVRSAHAVPSNYSDHYMTLTEVDVPVRRTGPALVEGAVARGGRGSGTVTTGDGV